MKAGKNSWPEIRNTRKWIRTETSKEAADWTFNDDLEHIHSGRGNNIKADMEIHVVGFFTGTRLCLNKEHIKCCGFAETIAYRFCKNLIQKSTKMAIVHYLIYMTLSSRNITVKYKDNTKVLLNNILVFLAFLHFQVTCGQISFCFAQTTVQLFL